MIIILWPKHLGSRGGGWVGGMDWLKGTQAGYSAGTFPRGPATCPPAVTHIHSSCIASRLLIHPHNLICIIYFSQFFF